MYMFKYLFTTPPFVQPLQVHPAASSPPQAPAPTNPPRPHRAPTTPPPHPATKARRAPRGSPWPPWPPRPWATIPRPPGGDMMHASHMDWHTTDIMVRIKDSHDDPSLIFKEGVIRTIQVSAYPLIESRIHTYSTCRPCLAKAIVMKQLQSIWHKLYPVVPSKNPPFCSIILFKLLAVHKYCPSDRTLNRGPVPWRAIPSAC